MSRSRWLPFLSSLVACWLLLGAAAARESEPFEVVWIAIGEVAASAGAHATQAGRQLFTASSLSALTQEGARVARVDIEPVVVEIAAGQQVCISALQVRVFGADGQQISGAPLSVAVRVDDREKLQLARSTRDICMRPSRQGEYPIRFTSLLPAPDGTTRGAQVFVRAAQRVSTAD